MPSRIYLSLGSNLGDREHHLREAISRLRALGQLAAISSFYETEPVDFIDQPWFLNTVVALDTDQTAPQLMSAMLAIEEAMGRVRNQSKGPRVIDLDILLFGDQVIDTPTLTVPHPAMPERRFVLAPLAEIAPDTVHPLLHKTISGLLEELPAGQTVRKYEPGR